MLMKKIKNVCLKYEFDRDITGLKEHQQMQRQIHE
jgi:hypothetical protein